MLSAAEVQEALLSAAVDQEAVLSAAVVLEAVLSAAEVQEAMLSAAEVQEAVFSAGPILFVCYINDMPEVVDSPVHMFADDKKKTTDKSPLSLTKRNYRQT